jgi:hypothetical protein
VADHLQSKKNEAKLKYLNHTPLPVIAQELGVSINTLKVWVYGYRQPRDKKNRSWLEQRNEIESQITASFKESKSALLHDISSMALRTLRDSIAEASKHSPLPISECKKLADILASLDKIMRLDLGMSTENMTINPPPALTTEDFRKLASDYGYFETDTLEPAQKCVNG